MPIRLFDLLDRGAHHAGDLERGDAGGDRERRERVPHRIRRPVLQPRAADGAVPVVATPVVQVQMTFTDAHGPNLRMLEWSVPEDADITKTTVVKKANPASWITTRALREQHEAVAEVAYRRYHCNQ